MKRLSDEQILQTILAILWNEHFERTKHKPRAIEFCSTCSYLKAMNDEIEQRAYDDLKPIYEGEDNGKN